MGVAISIKMCFMTDNKVSLWTTKLDFRILSVFINWLVLKKIRNLCLFAFLNSLPAEPNHLVGNSVACFTPFLKSHLTNFIRPIDVINPQTPNILGQRKDLLVVLIDMFYVKRFSAVTMVTMVLPTDARCQLVQLHVHNTHTGNKGSGIYRAPLRFAQLYRDYVLCSMQNTQYSTSAFSRYRKVQSVIHMKTSIDCLGLETI
uniref:Uncharacterized protein n=1 Tax=Strigamia maritima TaxID=126957 RepID=T1IYT0_STRMM